MCSILHNNLALPTPSAQISNTLICLRHTALFLLLCNYCPLLYIHFPSTIPPLLSHIQYAHICIGCTMALREKLPRNAKKVVNYSTIKPQTKQKKAVAIQEAQLSTTPTKQIGISRNILQRINALLVYLIITAIKVAPKKKKIARWTFAQTKQLRKFYKSVRLWYKIGQHLQWPTINGKNTRQVCMLCFYTQSFATSLFYFPTM